MLIPIIRLISICAYCNAFQFSSEFKENVFFYVIFVFLDMIFKVNEIYLSLLNIVYIQFISMVEIVRTSGGYRLRVMVLGWSSPTGLLRLYMVTVTCST